MRSLFRPASLFVAGTYLVLSAMPFFPFAFGRPVDHPWGIAGLEGAIWLALWAVFKRPAYFHWLLLPAFLALPVEVYLNVYYNQGISTHHLGIIAETSPRETLEFLGDKVWLLLLLIVGIVAWWAGSWRAAFKTRALDWNDPSRWLAIGLLAAAAGTWTYQQEYGTRTHVASSEIARTGASDEEDDEDESADVASPASSTVAAGASSRHYPALPAWAAVPFDLDRFGKTWPLGIAMRGVDFWKERTYLAELAHKSTLFTFGAVQASAADIPQVVVMVIGESSRYDRWSLNGYARETNPLLKKEKNLVSLSNVVTAVSATRLSVPVLVSRKPATQSLQAGFSEKSFLTAFKEAGFKTWWISNQMSFGQFDTPISVFAKEADVTQFLNLGGFTNNSSVDGILLDPLKTAIADPAKKKLIVLHTLGNHWNYSHRYPKEFDKFQPSLFGIENPAYTDTKLKPQLNNSYDNSILYTDWLLSQVIGTLKTSQQLTSLMYVSDHGQTLYDGSCNLAFHGHNTQYEFHIPALVWYSDLYRTTHPLKVNQLLRNKRAKLATENVFHSLLDMADIRYGTEQLEWSFLSKKFRPHKRYVDSYGWTDYDNATFRGDCREVIDKGKPLVQVK
ncbi:phosphoethanolamine transferase [Oxalobacteraceae bacterium OM1]|nr:phosphoethanolamine transferase [Oxalobacteraceae bacterium OM1]